MNRTTNSDDKMQHNPNRREFLMRAQQLLLSASILTLSPFSLRARDIDALDLKYLQTSSALMLAQISRLLFPHQSLADTVYLQVVQDIDVDMSADTKTRALLSEGINILQKKSAGDWVGMSQYEQLAALKSLQGSDLFTYLHNRTIESLYRNPEVWKLLGYQGSSIEYGGYLHRGFDDIDWLDK